MVRCQEERTRVAAVVVIQRFWRSYRSRRRAEEVRKKLFHRHLSIHRLRPILLQFKSVVIDFKTAVESVFAKSLRFGNERQRLSTI